MAKFTQVSWSQFLKPATSLLLLRGAHKPNSSDSHWRPDACQKKKRYTVSCCNSFFHMHNNSWTYWTVLFKPDDWNNKGTITVRLTSRRDIFNSLPWHPDVFITVTPTSGKVLCNYFIEVSTRHHPRKLPYWCRGCQCPEIKSADIQICIDLLFFHHRIIRRQIGRPWIADSRL